MKYLIIGPPKSGKSTYARKLREQGIPTYCTDPAYAVKDPEPDVTYAPDLEWSEVSEHVARKWMAMPAPWCIEGVGAVRALRKYLVMNKPDTIKDVTMIVFDRPRPGLAEKKHASTTKAIATIWAQVSMAIDHRTPIIWFNP